MPQSDTAAEINPEYVEKLFAHIYVDLGQRTEAKDGFRLYAVETLIQIKPGPPVNLAWCLPAPRFTEAYDSILMSDKLEKQCLQG